MIVQELHSIQGRYGYLPEADLRALSERIKTPLYRLHEVASFFPHFRFDPPPPVEVHICRDMSCYHNGAVKLRMELEGRCEQQIRDGKVHVGGVSCLGRCDRAPAVLVNEKLFARRTIDEFVGAVQDAAGGKPLSPDTDTAYPNCNPTPWQVDPYDDGSHEPYEAALRLMRELDSEGAEGPTRRVIDALATASLRGMGGAGEPTGRKWEDVIAAPGDEKFVVCNADESEPATFKDRELLLRKPHLIIEGMVIAGLLFGAKQGFVYVRHEYPEQIERMRRAIRDAERKGVCGSAMRSPNRSFTLEVYVSPGGYICGEQSALIQAMEDQRAEPRNKPPTLATNGLFDKPTLVNNVETFAWVPAVLLRDGGRWYAEQGVNGAKGRRFFSVSGDVTRPGVYEVPTGIKLGEFLNEYAQGMRDGVAMKAFAPSGPSGGFLPRMIPVSTLPPRAVEVLPPGTTHLDLYDVPMDLDAFRNFGLMLGAGVVVYGPKTKIVREAVNALEFFRNESCGKCVPCRIGSQKLTEIGNRLIGRQYAKAAFADEEALIRELARAMEITSICGLGAVASNPVTTLVRYFRDDVEQYLNGG